MQLIEHNPDFFTATILNWKPLLRSNKYKDIILQSLSFLVQKQRIILYAFVIMDNHLHLIWQMGAGHRRQDIQRDFLKYTAQQIRFDLMKNNSQFLKEFEVNSSDRKYQFWQRNPLSIELNSAEVLEQKLDYIHDNPVKAGLSKTPEGYFHSSASYYILQSSAFEFLTHHDY